MHKLRLILLGSTSLVVPNWSAQPQSTASRPLPRDSIISDNYEWSTRPSGKLPEQSHREMSSFDATLLSSPSGRITWFCFVAVCVVVPFICCVIFCALRVHQREMEAREEQEEQANTALSRIEANVKVFAQKEDQRRIQSIRRSMKRNLFVVDENDLQATTTDDISGESDLESAQFDGASSSRIKLSSGCSICLEPFVAGDTLMHSVDVDNCRHVFHELCICEWLAKTNTSACPCCRQEFVGTETPVTSLSSPEVFQTAFGLQEAMDSDLEQGRA